MVCPTSGQWNPFQRTFDHCFCKVRCLWRNECNVVWHLHRINIVKVAWQELLWTTRLCLYWLTACIPAANWSVAWQVCNMNCPRTHHLEESNARIQADNSDRRKLWERQYQCIDRVDPSGHFTTVFIIVSGTLIAASVNVRNALQIGKTCMEAYENN